MKIDVLIERDAWIYALGYVPEGPGREGEIVSQNPREILQLGEADVLRIAQRVGVKNAHYLRGRDLAISLIKSDLVALFEAGLNGMKAGVERAESDLIITKEGRKRLLLHFGMTTFEGVQERQVAALVEKFTEIRTFYEEYEKGTLCGKGTHP